jgi:hypothetical protein
MITRSMTAACVLLASLVAVAADNMTHEETVVRNAYAKLSYAVDLNTAYMIVQANPKINPSELAGQVELKGLRFQLGDFKVGNLADVADAKYSDTFDQYPAGQDVIRTSVATLSYNEVGGATGSMEAATAGWGPGPEGTAPN